METINETNIFIKNSVHPDAVKNVQWVDNVEPLPLTDFEKNMNKGFITPEQLLEQEKKEQEEPKEETEEEKTKRKQRDYITKVKVIALDKLGKNPLSNPSGFTTREKKRLIEQMEEIMKKSEEEITTLFNAVCNEVIFAPEANYQFYPVYSNK